MLGSLAFMGKFRALAYKFIPEKMVIVERLWIPCKQLSSVSDVFCGHFDKSFMGNLTGFCKWT